MNSLGISIGILAGGLLALRYGANILFGPLIGSLSDRIGQKSSLALLSTIILMGVSLAIYLPIEWLAISIALIFIASSGFFVTANANASKVSKQSTRPNIYIGFFNTSVDAGAAFGPLFVYSSRVILESLEIAYFLSAIFLFIVVQGYVRVAAKES